MMFLKVVGFSFIAFAFGVIVSLGVFAVLIAVGLVPRFADKTDTADHIFWYEDVIVLGILAGVFGSVFQGTIKPATLLGETVGWQVFAQFFLGLYGIFTGMFVGCLAVAIAEMLDSIPIFARRISFEKGLGIALLGLSLGKLAGSLVYFFTN